MTTPAPPPPYVPTMYVDGSLDTPVSAANLRKNETALKAVSDWAAQCLPVTALAGPGPTNGGGIATTDSSGVVEQAPHAHSHSLSVKDGNGGGSEQFVTGIDFYGGTGAFTVAGGRLQYHSEPADVRVYRLGAANNYASNVPIVGVTNVQLPDLTDVFAAGDHFDYDLLLYISSTSAAQASAILQVPSGAQDHYATVLTPNESIKITNDVANWRAPTIPVAQSGLQNMGGFPASGSGISVFRQWGSFRMGSSATGSMKVLAKQLAAVDTTFAVPFHSRLILARAV